MLENEPFDRAVSSDRDAITDATTEDRDNGSGASEAPSEPEARAARPRRRAVSRPAGPPPEPEDVPPPVQVTTVPAGADHKVSEPVARPIKGARRSAGAVEDEESAPAAERPASEPAEKTAGGAAEQSARPEPVADEAARAASAEPEAGTAEPEDDRAESAQPALAGERTESGASPTRRRRIRRRTRSGQAVPSVMTAAVEEVATALRIGPAEDAHGEEPAEPGAAATEAREGEPAAERSTGVVRPDVVTDPFGFNNSAERPAVPKVTFQSPASLFQPIFQPPDPAAAIPLSRRAASDEPEEAEDHAEAERAEEAGEETATPRRRRRRRGGRGRSRAKEAAETEAQEPEPEPEKTSAEAAGRSGAAAEEERPAEEEPAAEQTSVEQTSTEQAEAEEQPAETTSETATEQQAAQAEQATGTSRRRRRRRRRSTEEIEPTPDDPPNTVIRIRAPRTAKPSSSLLDEVQGVRGSTRLEAKKQRRREGRELGRRRPLILTESEFLARRESVERIMIIRRNAGRTQVAVLEDGVLVEHYVDRESNRSYVGNVYLGKVQNVLPSMEAAFVDIGKGRNAVLYAGEVNFDSAGLEGQPKRIEAALKSGQSVLVQVTKDPIGHKGARLTSQITLPGRYLVYVPDGSMTGISRKLPDKERARLKQILRKVMPENAGVIVRTAAEGATEEELSRDVARLAAQWESIQRKAKTASPPELLLGEPDLMIRVVRDIFNEDFSTLIVQGDEAWNTVEEYVRYVAPHLLDRLKKWDEETDVFTAYRIDEQIAKALERKVWLPSGGSLVIDQTEAMTVIDVNTGKFTGQGGNLEETVTRNNLEAAEEIVRQLRLRDIGGIIVIDFIDMVLESNRELVLRRLLECLSRDRTKHQVAEVTSLGLVQMTRKRVGQGLLEAFSTPCECCNGRGIIISSEPVEKPEPRGTQGKMAIEKAVAEKLAAAAENKSTSVVAATSTVRETVTDSIPVDDGAAAGRAREGRRSRGKAAE